MAVLGNCLDETRGEGVGAAKLPDAHHAAVAFDRVLRLRVGQVDGRKCGLAQKLRALAGRADGFVVFEGFVDEVQGVALLHQGVDRGSAAGDKDRVEHDGGCGDKGFVDLDGGAVVGGEGAAELGDDLGPGTLLHQHVFDLLELLASEAFGQEDGDLAALDGVFDGVFHAHGRGGFAVVFGGRGRWRGDADAGGDAFGKVVVNLVEVFDHAFAHFHRHHLAELKVGGAHEVVFL